MTIPIERLIPRIDTLEMRVMQQDQVIEDLNATITAQWRQIDALTRQIARLDDRMRETVEPTVALPDAPPPHY